MLASGSKEQTAIGSEGQTAEEGREGFVGVHASTASRHIQTTTDTGRSRRHDGG